jgi:hypothetical protein
MTYTQDATVPMTNKLSALVNSLSLPIAFVLAIALLSAADLRAVKLSEAALGGQTAAVLGEVNGFRIACLDATDTQTCEEAYSRAGHPPAVLWLGNSQNFAINRYHPGDELAIMTTHRWLEERGAWLVSYNQPNANFYEQAVVFEAVARRYDTRLLILPAFMDKLREQGIRESVAKFMADPRSKKWVPASPEWSQLAPVLEQASGREGQVPINQTIQATVEDRFNAVLNEHLRLWREREILRGTLGIAIHGLRDKVLNIHSYTKRPVDENVYSDKLRMLASILESAQNQRIRVLLYIPPYRTDISGPYVDGQYIQFKKDVQALAQKYGANYADLSDLVPGPEWATVVDSVLGFEEPDFMHFTAEGQRRLADAIQGQLKGLGF